jgi:hypothetical protein
MVSRPKPEAIDPNRIKETELEMFQNINQKSAFANVRNSKSSDQYL